MNLKWMLKVNDKYVDVTGQWSTSETINTHFITKFGDKQKLRIKFPFDEIEKTTATYAFRIYIPNVFDFDYEGSNQANMISTISAVDVSGIDEGRRLIGRYVSAPINFYYYYELRTEYTADTQLNVISPDTPSDQKKWVLIDSRRYGAQSGKPASSITYHSINLNYLPNGLEPPEEIKLTSTLKNNNKVDEEIELNLFDEYGQITNGANIYSNFMTSTDGTPISAWTKVGGTVSKTIQQHLLDFNTKLLKQPREVINASFLSDVQVTPLSTLIDTGQSNKIYYIQGLTLNDYTEEYSGEIIEIGSDNLPTSTSGFTTGFEQDAVN
jgi:hypothetical protein